MKTFLLSAWLTVLSGAIAFVFWYNEWQYSLPTPIPTGYHAVQTGAMINLKNYPLLQTSRPLFLHFFNPDCPCSQFNRQHFKMLVDKYNNRVQFAIVVISKNKRYSEQEIADKFGVNVPVSSDSSLAAICGVYSTPQAAIITASHQLYYRGNYNRTRYCTDGQSDYAMMAIDSLLGGITTPAFSKATAISYGCGLPKCSR